MGIYRHGDNSTLVNSADDLKILDPIATILKKGGVTVEVAGEMLGCTPSRQNWLADHSHADRGRNLPKIITT
jgi:hypothetical protein